MTELEESGLLYREDELRRRGRRKRRRRRRRRGGGRREEKKIYNIIHTYLYISIYIHNLYMYYMYILSAYPFEKERFFVSK